MSRGATRPELEAPVGRLREELAVERDQREALQTVVAQPETDRDHFAQLFDSAPIGFAELDGNGCIRAINLAGAGLLGKDRRLLVGQPLLPCFVPEDRRAWLRELRSLRRQMSASVELRVAAGAPAPAALLFHLSRATEEPPASRRAVHVRAAFLDVTARRAAEAAARESEARLADFAAATREGIVHSEEGRIVDCNAQFAQMLGYTEAELKGAAIESLVAPEDRERVGANIREGRTSVAEHAALCKDGTRIIVEARGRSTRPEIPRRFTVVHDITARRQREQELERLNRTLRATRESGQALLRAQDVPGLLAEVCRIVVEDCGHAMVWIGLAEHDEARSVRPVACAGFEAGYLETLHLTWADTERGRGPTGVAIRTGRVAMCRNMQTDPQFAPWRAEALKRNYASSIALPLRENEQAFGALTIYSREPDPFTADEVRLLAELADDLAAGIGTFRLRAAQAQAETALQESEERLRFHLEHSPLAVVEWDQDFVVTRWSARAEQVFGWSAAETVGRPVADLHMIHEADLPIVRATMEMLTDGVSRQVVSTTRNVTKTGAVRDCTWHNTVQYDAEGRMRSVLSLVQDVTERKATEETLRFLGQRSGAESGADFFRELAQYLARTLAMDFVCIDRLETDQLTASTLAVFHNGRFQDNGSYALKDTPCGEVVGKAVCSFPRDVRRLFPRDAVLQDLAAESYLGTTLWSSQGRPIGLIAVIGRRPLAETRIAESVLQLVAVRAAGELERRRADETLRASEERYRTLFQSLQEGFYLADALYDAQGRMIDAVYRDANPAFLRMVGRAREELLDRRMREIVPALKPEWLEVFAGVVATGCPAAHVAHSDHFGRDFEAFVFRPAPGRFGVLVSDVTERERAAAKVRQLNAELEQRVRERTAELQASNRELEAFCYSVSHDLRAPLRSMDGFSQAVLEDCGGQLDAEGQDHLRRIRANCQHMARLIDDLLELSRLTRSQMRRQRVDLTGLARAVGAELQQSAPGRRAEFRIAEGLSATGDPTLLRAALWNLLENAWKFTASRPVAAIEFGRAEGGVVEGRRSGVMECGSDGVVAGGTGETQADAAASVADALRAANTPVLQHSTTPAVQHSTTPALHHSVSSGPAFFIRDNGVGFDPRYADKLFTPFQRLHSAREYPGSGIGLATVQRVVQRHGGRVWAEAAPDRGATFFFTLGGQDEETTVVSP